MGNLTDGRHGEDWEEMKKEGKENLKEEKKSTKKISGG